MIFLTFPLKFQILPGTQEENGCRCIQAGDCFARVLQETPNIMQNMENEIDDAPSAYTNVTETTALL